MPTFFKTKSPVFSVLTMAAFAGVLCGFFTQPAHAGNTTEGSYSADSLLLGFRQTSGQGSSLDYLLDLGPISQLNGGKGLTQSFTILSTGTTGYGSVGTDLKSFFGNNYYTDGSVLFSLEAATNSSQVGSDGPNTLYTTVPSGESGNASFSRQASGTQGTASGNIANVGTAYSGAMSTANSDLGVKQVIASVTNSYGSYQGPGTNTSNDSFNYFDPSNEATVNTALSFERIATATKNSGFQGMPALLWVHSAWTPQATCPLLLSPFRKVRPACTSSPVWHSCSFFGSAGN